MSYSEVSERQDHRSFISTDPPKKETTMSSYYATQTKSASMAAITFAGTSSSLVRSSQYASASMDLDDGTIQEARLVRKKQKDHPRQEITHKKTTEETPPVMEGPEDQETEIESPPVDSPAGLGKVGTALLSVGGVLMVAGITGGIFVWRAAQHPPTNASKVQLPHLLDLEASPKDDPEDTVVSNQRQNGLDFNYSMEKLFHNTTRQHPVSEDRPIPRPPVISNPAHAPVSEEKVQIDDESIHDLYAASPISIYFPSTTQ
ncbi:hypothetical protein BC941DRAFT_452173 [Chlamydoabsidia padenii]|nr:hypothetical protein BC941DRAFT_452173 [Chlamydoabsidia padenii]